MSICRRWDIQVGRNPWFSLGIHIDHTDPSLTFHLPWVIVALGRLKLPGFVHGWSLRGVKVLREHEEKRSEA